MTNVKANAVNSNGISTNYIVVTDYGAVGDGTIDNASALQTAIKAASTTRAILFPAGNYRVSSNVTFPVGIMLIFVQGAVLVPDVGVLVTIGSDLEAGLYRIFGGQGKVTVATAPLYAVYPEWFGASGSGNQYYAAIQSGSRQVTFTGVPDFKVGQKIKIFHAGSPVVFKPITTAAQLTYHNLSGNPLPINGSTKYMYQFVLITKQGAVSSVSPIAMLTGGPPSLDLEHEININWAHSLPGQPYDGVILYGAPTNPAGSRNIIYWQNGSESSYNDTGKGDITPNVPGWVPATPPTDHSLANTTLVATVIAGEGTNVITIDQDCQSTLASALVIHEDTGAIQAANDFLVSGGTVEFRGQTYNITSDPTLNHALSISGNVHWKGGLSPRPALQTWRSIGYDGETMVYANKATDWSIKELCFDGNAKVDYTETNMSGIGIGMGCSRFQVSDCEFTGLYSKAFDSQGTDASWWEFRRNYIHEMNSNAIGIGGTNFVVSDNIIDTCLLTTQPNHDPIGGAESIIGGTGMTNAVIRNNTIKDWGPISLVDQNNPIIDLQIVGNHLQQSINSQLLGLGNALLGIGGNGQTNNVVLSANIFRGLLNDPGVGPGGITQTMIRVMANNVTIDGNVVIGSANLDVANPGVTYTSGGIQVNGSNAVVSSNVIIQGGILIIGNYGDIIGNTVTSPFSWQTNSLTVIGDSAVISGNNGPLSLVSADIEGSNGICTGNALSGLRISGSAVVSGNTLGYVNIPGGNNITISGNHVTQYIQSFSGDQMVVNGNLIDGYIAGYGGFTNSVIDGNIFNPSTRTGAVIALSKASNTIIANNQFSAQNVEYRVIELDAGTSNVQILNNSFSNIPNNVAAVQDMGGTGNVVSYNSGIHSVPQFGTQMPAFGQWSLGDIVYNTTPASGGALGWVCTTSGTANNTAWAPGRSYAVNQLVSNAGGVYQCTTAIAVSNTAPTGRGASIPDGNGTWRYVSTQAVFKSFAPIGA